MKRALAIAVALCTIGFAGFSQIAIKGSWTATLGLLPSVTLSSNLSLTYTVAGFDITSTTGFSATGLSSQKFDLKGVFGPFTVTGSMLFDVAAVLYDESVLSTSFDFGGIAIGFKAEHWAIPPNQTPTWCTTLAGGAALRYTFTGTIAPATVKAVFVDCCTGTAFYNLNVTLKGLGLCCGITYNVEFDFLKSGFNYVKFTGIDIPLCCGVTLGVTVTYGVDYKTLEVNPSFGGFVDACFTVWGDATFSGYTWFGIEIYGFKIRCTLADCNYIEFVNAFNVTAVNPKLPTADRFLAACGEFELIKMGFCGAGCCGGKYDVTLRVFFGSGGGIFDITRMVFGVKIPIMSNFTLNIDGTMAAASCATTNLSIGWTFTF